MLVVGFRLKLGNLRIFIDGIGTDHASLHANMFPLTFGLVPEKHRQTVIEHIKSRGMACSVYGAQHLLDGLYAAGEADYAMSLMTSDSRFSVEPSALARSSSRSSGFSHGRSRSR